MHTDHEPHHDVTQQRAVLLDIGDGYGALVVTTSSRLAGAEIHVTAAHAVTSTHVEVHERRTPSGEGVFSAVFPSLRAGRYHGSLADGEELGAWTVHDGLVTFAAAVP